MDESALVSRERARAELAERSFDVLVIGAGIVGAGIANEAAHAGLTVALVDRADFGGATSSASSKLIHGGLRYLRLGDVRLVREAHHERRILERVVAPHLVRRLPFLLPLYSHGPYRPLVVQTGIVLYSTIARTRLNGLVDVERAHRMVPELVTHDLRACAFYADASTHDSRLCLANVRAAAERGATVLNYAEVVELHAGRGATIAVDGEHVDVRARVVVNATGPWVDHVRRLEDPRAGTSVRLSKGAHVLLERSSSWSAALTVPHDKVRVTFAVPWEGMLLVGTTDTLYDGDISDVQATQEDVDGILGEAAAAIAGDVLRRERVRSTFAGLRVLPGGDGATAIARRETVFTRGPSGMLTVAGGKLTTYRRIALDALRRVRGELGLRRVDDRPRPLPGAVGFDRVSFPEALDARTRSHLLNLYGSLVTELLAQAQDDPALLEPLHVDGPDIAAQAVYARTHEWAVGVEDVLRRRTTLALRGVTGDDVVRRVEAALERAGVRG